MENNNINEKNNILKDSKYEIVCNYPTNIKKHIFIKNGEKWNIIDKHGNILSKVWYDKMWNVDNSKLIGVILDNKVNWLKEDGEYLSEQWFNNACPPYYGISCVELYHKYNFINLKTGKLLSDKWYEWVGDFNHGVADIQVRDKHNIMDQSGNILSKEWFDFIGINIDGYSMVKNNGMWNFLSSNGELLFNEWFDNVKGFIKGNAFVCKDGKWIKIKIFENQDDFYEELNNINNKHACSCDVKIETKDEKRPSNIYIYEYKITERSDGKKNLIRENKYLSEEWFDDVRYFNVKYAKVTLNGKENLLGVDGKYFYSKWFDYVYLYDSYLYGNVLSLVSMNGKENIINEDELYISSQWFDYIGRFWNNCALVADSISLPISTNR